MIEERFDRNIGIWNEEFQAKQKEYIVAIAGCGGAGGQSATVLAQNGFEQFKLADFDIFETTNIQRQMYANEKTLGRHKAEVIAEAILNINPEAKIQLYKNGITELNVDDFVQGSHFVYEVVDYSAPHIKTLIHRKAREYGIISSTAAIFGTGTVSITFHPTEGMTYEEYFKNPGTDPEHKLDLSTTLGRFPDYINQEHFLRRVTTGKIPTTADGAMLTGITATLIKRLMMGKKIAYAPSIVRVDMLDEELYWKNVHLNDLVQND